MGEGILVKGYLEWRQYLGCKCIFNLKNKCIVLKESFSDYGMKILDLGNVIVFSLGFVGR